MQSVFLFWFFWDWICSASFPCSNFIHREFYFLFLWVVSLSPYIYRHQSFIFISSSPSLMATGNARRIFNMSLWLSVVSLSHLNDAMRPLRLFPLCPKSTTMEAIVNNVLQDWAQFTSRDATHSILLPSFISHHFNSRYGETVGNALWDLWKPSDFSMQHIHVNYSLLYGQSWLSYSYDIMYSHLMQVLKQDILNCLHFIPSNLRPSYNTWSAQSCHSALLNHIRVQILFFVSLSQSEFLGVFLSMFPYDEHYWSAHSLLTDKTFHRKQSIEV